MVNHIMVMDKASAKLGKRRGTQTKGRAARKLCLQNAVKLFKLETALKKKEEILEEQSCTLLKLEVEVKERMRKVETLERRSCDLEKGWEELREEQGALLKQREYLASVRTQFEQLAANQKAELSSQAKERDELNRMKERLEKQRGEAGQLLEALREKEVKAAEKESQLFEMECKFLKGRSQIENDAEELRQQLRKAHAELDAQRRYVEDRQQAVDSAVMSLKEEATKLNARKREVDEREQLLQTLEESQKSRLQSEEESLRKRYLCGKDSMMEGTALAECTLENGQTQTETAILIKERENLRAQQLELEKTKLAVQEAKSTLTVQLKASKKMVADASLIAQKASREREALEEERKLLVEKKKEIESSLCAKEMQIKTEAKRVESMKKALDDKLQRCGNLVACYGGSDMKPKESSSSEEILCRREDEQVTSAAMASYDLTSSRLPSQKRLENVMSSLLDARQASRSRLVRTENALAGLSTSAPSTIEVRQALRALSTRLSSMEQVEESLACQLREAYEAECTEEVAIVDKVELLSKMEEQQNLRAEWEQDMQQQLERISMLHTASSTGGTRRC